jgi:anaerobic nitric oxide reductase flavorubredoxin
MLPISIRPDVFWIGVNDRTTDLFEGIWPISQEGVSYNAYIIRDDRTAVVDLAKTLKADDFLSQIRQVTELSRLDYVIINHMEPDHSGLLRTLRNVAPSVTIVGTEKTARMLDSFYGISDGIHVVQDGEALELGSHTLRFVHTPFVHWPETMMTYAVEDKILFSCDAFGGYGALQGTIFDGECTALSFYEAEALRYYVNIVGVFSSPVLKAIGKLSDYDLDIVAPSHGLVWRDNPTRIIDLYAKWAGYANGPADEGITMVFASMYGNTERMMNAVAQGVSKAGVPMSIFDVTHTHVSYILPSLWIQRGVMVGAPTYEGSLFPTMVNVLQMAERKRIRNKRVARFGSYGWSGGAQRHFERLIESLKWELVDTLEFAGGPSAQDLEAGVDFGHRFALSVKDDNYLGETA